MGVKQFTDDVIVITCPVCEKDTEFKLPAEYEPKFMEEFGQFENLSIPCQSCLAEGRNTTNIVNLNLPELDEMELEVMEVLAPEDEVVARKAVRDLMWKKRPDLKKKNRDTERKKYAKDNAAKIKQIKDNIEASRQNQGKF